MILVLLHLSTLVRSGRWDYIRDLLVFLKVIIHIEQKNCQFVHNHAINTKKLNLIAHLVTPEETTGNRTSSQLGTGVERKTVQIA